MHYVVQIISYLWILLDNPGHLNTYLNTASLVISCLRCGVLGLIMRGFVMFSHICLQFDTSVDSYQYRYS